MSPKKKLWKLTSEYVRRKNADSNGYVSCVTCGLTKHYKEIQAGHFIPKAQGLSIYFDLRNIHPQCYRCNINLGGNGPEYYTFMLREYGTEVIDELRKLSKTTIKISKGEYEERIEAMENMLSSL